MPRVTPDGYRKVPASDLPLLECNACGAVVASPGRHDQWHDGLIARLEGIERDAVTVDVDKLHATAEAKWSDLVQRAERARRPA